jgi:hypothetical protein
MSKLVYKFIWYFTKNIFVKPNIRPDILYPAFGLAGYQAKTVPVSGASLIRTSRPFSLPHWSRATVRYLCRYSWQEGCKYQEASHHGHHVSLVLQDLKRNALINTNKKSVYRSCITVFISGPERKKLMRRRILVCVFGNVQKTGKNTPVPV